MLNPEESIVELKKYLIKFRSIIQHETKFSLGSSKLVDKKNIDDILCCLEATFPKEYKLYLKQQGQTKLKSGKYYLQLKGAIQNKFLWFTSFYLVRTEEALALIKSLGAALEADIRFVYSDASGMF